MRLTASGPGWTVSAPARARGARRGAAPGSPASLPREFLLPGVEVADVQQAQPRARRGAAPPPLEATVQCEPGEHAVVVARHPSGALTFHGPLEVEPTRRRGARAARAPRTLRFHVELAEAALARRGVVTQALTLLAVKVREALVDEAVRLGLRAASRAAESAWWKARKLKEGWCAIEPGAGGALALRHLERVPSGSGRGLLLLHGTFSSTEGSYGKLLSPSVLKDLRDRYGGRVFGFEHFSVSRSLEDNARALLEALPDRENVFDVASYSRGGLVLRTLAEQPERFGALARRFRLGQAVLVATPNRGTPLATGDRWEDTLGLVANLIDWLPDSPWTTGASLVAHGIVWLAGHVSGDLPGLAAMDGNGETIAALQEGRGPASGTYSAIVGNYEPEAALWRRLVDAGVDGFFDGANDLVVPTAGAWQVDSAAADVVPAARVACFGAGGNLAARAGGVHHLNVLAQAETARFVMNALVGTAQELPPVDLSRPLRASRSWRGGPVVARTTATGPRRQPRTETAAPVLVPAPPLELLAVPEREGDRTLQLMIMGRRREEAQILAMYGSARVVEPLPLRNPAGATDASVRAGSRFNQIIRHHRRIQMSLAGLAGPRGEPLALPDDEGLREFGTALFEALFVGRVRRLYDVARAEQRERALNVVFTCAIPWVASLPWEFAWDPVRRKFLATEEVHFVRNVLTSVPAQRVEGRRPPLRLLVVQAQPAGTAQLELADEEERIRHRFQSLVDGRLAEIDALADATPEGLHERVFSSWLERRPYDIVHFSGHGEFDRDAQEGRLLFVSADGGERAVDVQTLREILCGRGVQLVFLNACETGEDARRVLNRGVGQALVEGGLPAVVVNQYKVLDPSAVAFAERFYWALAHGASFGEAARESRISVNYGTDSETIDWAVPALYARDPDQRLCERRAQVTALHPAEPRREREAAAATRGPRPYALGIADLARFFPGIGSILARLDDAQDQFRVRQVDVTAPMGVWVRKPRSTQTYLHAERFATKLRDKPRALGVDYLGCVTNWWMRDEDEWDIYGWWDTEDPKMRILIFSTAGLALPAEGPAAGRVLANAIVGGLAAHMLDTQSSTGAVHDRGPRDCPFYYNPHRDVASVAGRQRFDGACRRRLEARVGQALVRAFDAMLGAYDAELGERS